MLTSKLTMCDKTEPKLMSQKTQQHRRVFQMDYFVVFNFSELRSVMLCSNLMAKRAKESITC